MRDVATLIVDDQDDVRTLVRLTIEAANEGLRVVGEACDGIEAVELWEQLRPDVVVLDHMMPRMTGLAAAEMIRRRHPDQPIVMFSAYLDEQLQHQAAEIGVRCCLAKEEVRRLPDAVLATSTDPHHRC